MSHKRKLGFTLIELLVVIAIIGILSSVILVTMGDIRLKARDSKRLGDIRWFSTMVEQARNLSTGSYTTLSESTPSDIDGHTVPTNNNSDDGTYGWQDNTGDDDKFCVWASLEHPDAVASYFIANTLGAGYSNVAPADIDNCLFDNGDDTSTVCHFPAGNPEGFFSLNVATENVAAYLEQGAHSGSCTESSEMTMCHLFVTITSPPVDVATYTGLGATVGPC